MYVWGALRYVLRVYAGCVPQRGAGCLMRLGFGRRWCCWVLVWVYETPLTVCDEQHYGALRGQNILSIFTASHENTA